MVEFMASSGLRASEVAGLEVGDLTFAPGPKCTVKVARTKERKGGQWVTGTPKSKKSRRSAPLLACDVQVNTCVPICSPQENTCVNAHIVDYPSEDEY
jgi:hypothetical protein